MTPTILLLGAILAVVLFIAWKHLQPIATEDEERFKHELEHLRKDMQDSRLKDREHLQERIDHVSKLLSQNMHDSAKTMLGQFSQTHDIIKQVTSQLTKLDQTNRQVVNFSQQLKDLQSILQNPKGKGVLSEYWLETLLSHVLPPEQYKMQFKFKNGEIVDAAVFFQDKVIPIDAKFSSNKYNDITKEDDRDKREKMEGDFKKDLKIRIDETAKYIRPEESTTDYAFMFIPAEGIYYDLLVHQVGTMEINRLNLIQYAHSKRVLIVSPNTFFAFLQTVIEGLRAFKVQQSVQDVLKRVEKLGKHLGSYEEYMAKMGNHLGTTVNMYNQAYKEFEKIDTDIFKLTDGKAGGEAEMLTVQKPTAHIEETFEKITSSNVKDQVR